MGGDSRGVILCYASTLPRHEWFKELAKKFFDFYVSKNVNEFSIVQGGEGFFLISFHKSDNRIDFILNIFNIDFEGFQFMLGNWIYLIKGFCIEN